MAKQQLPPFHTFNGVKPLLEILGVGFHRTIVFRLGWQQKRQHDGFEIPIR